MKAAIPRNTMHESNEIRALRKQLLLARSTLHRLRAQTAMKDVGLIVRQPFVLTKTIFAAFKTPLLVSVTRSTLRSALIAMAIRRFGNSGSSRMVKWLTVASQVLLVAKLVSRAANKPCEK